MERVKRIVSALIAMLLISLASGCLSGAYERTDDFIKEPLLSWRGQSSLRPGSDTEGVAIGYHFVPRKGLSLHNYKIIAPVAFTSVFSMTLDFDLNCKPSGADDGHWDGFFVLMINVLRVPCIGDDYLMPAACPPPTELAFLFLRNNPVQKPTEPHLAVLFKGSEIIERTTDTGVVMDGKNRLTLQWFGNIITLSINDRVYDKFELDMPAGDLIGLEIVADSGHYDSELPPDDEGGLRIPEDVMYLERVNLWSRKGATFYVPESFYFDHLNEL
ncbi:MAG TPA: hypothetical protein PLT03_02990 [Bacillota bacterium]|nr:hypothetical protein [Bacillota bacterium]HOA15040.1 hypothetical protein [Bacillota bacterium]HOG52818.1 hypothetical protein [Bacillota bacterium]